VEAGSNEDGGSLTEMEWAQAFESWLEGQPSRHTRIAYRTAWGCLIEHAQAMPWELKREHILSWVEQMSLRGYSPKTIQLRVGAISSFFRDGLGGLVPNPTKYITIAEGEKRRRYLTAEQLEAFLSAIPTNTLTGKRDYALFLCYITTRRRTSEVRRLRYRDIKGLEAGRLVIVPTQSGRPATGLSTRDIRLREALQSYLDECGRQHCPDDYIFTAWRGGKSSGKPLTTDAVCKLVKKYARLASLGTWITVETLRRSGTPNIIEETK
jgi:integrase